MKDGQLKIAIEQIGVLLRDEGEQERDEDRTCRLLDAREYLRRAWHAIDGSATEDNWTSIETHRALQH